MAPVISIIIPTYNRAHLIGETLDSVLTQTFTNWECIIVDDGSTDDTKEFIADYIKKDKRFQYHSRPIDKIKGANSCRNYGFKVSKGKYIKWFDSDDLMFPDLLQIQLASFANITDVSVCKVGYYDSDNDWFIKESTIFSDNLIEDYLVGNIVFYVSGPLWKKSFLISLKELFDEKISNLDDWDFNLRMLYLSPKITFVNEVLIKYRVHENSLSKEIDKLNFDEIKSEFLARKKHLLILVFNNSYDTTNFKLFIIKRNKYHLREALLIKDSTDLFLLKNLLLTQLFLIDFKGLFNTLKGWVGLKFFNCGYKFFK